MRLNQGQSITGKRTPGKIVRQGTPVLNEE